MILILSHDKLEESTNDVIDWLTYYKAPYIRINREELKASNCLMNINTNIKEAIYLDNETIYPSDINVVWYRRWGVNKGLEQIVDESDIEFTNSINKYLYSENRALSFAFFNMFNHAYWLSYPGNRMENDKINSLRIAKKCGLLTPRTYILNSKSKLLKLLDIEKKGIITKSIFNVSKITIGNERYIQYTQEINSTNLEQIPNLFASSLFQEKIIKEYELRIFILEEEVYSMAIFSQNDTQTEVDFRKYNFKKPNRNIPYKLPIEIENKLKLFMKKMNLKTGSIDIIKDVNGNYIFLEINPVGQFGMVSLPCNYNLEKKIANHLIRKNNEQQFKK